MICGNVAICAPKILKFFKKNYCAEFEFWQRRNLRAKILKMASLAKRRNFSTEWRAGPGSFAYLV